MGENLLGLAAAASLKALWIIENDRCVPLALYRQGLMTANVDDRIDCLRWGGSGVALW